MTARLGKIATRVRPWWPALGFVAGFAYLDAWVNARYPGPEPPFWYLVPSLDTLVPDLSRGREIVAYCRGPYCVYADDAVRLLRAHGLKARRLDVGFPEWRRAGLPVETPS